MELLGQNHWSTIINIILQKYFSELHVTCLLWHSKFDFQLWPSYNAYLDIYPATLKSSFSDNVYDFKGKEEYFNRNGVYYTDLIEKLFASIETTNCEGFVAFQDDIPIFVEAFRKASAYSLWRTIYSRFLFVYTKEMQMENYFQDKFFKNQANIVIIESEFFNSSTFSLKTNKFVGSIDEQPEDVKHLSTFDALSNSFHPDLDLYSKEKFQDLEGREIIIATFDYRPFVAVDYNRYPKYYDRDVDNPTHLVHCDGAEPRIIHTFCELYNCTVQFDMSEKGEWGTSYPNYTGNGLVGMIMDGKVDLAIGAMMLWYAHYVVVDVSNFIGRSGITCLVPAPQRLLSWTLPLRPFQLLLWLAVGGCLLLECVSLIIARRFELTMHKAKNSWWSCTQFGYITTLKLFISQGSDYIVNSHTVRTVLFACYMIDIIITSIYGGGLSAILTTPTFEEAADSVERLYSHNLPWAATSAIWVEDIKDVDNPVYKRITKNFKILTMDEMREKAKTENMGFPLERLTFGHFANFDFITPESLNRLKLMIDDIYNGHSVVMVARLWAHLPKMNDFILNWRSSGFDKFWEWKISANYLNINDQNQIAASKIGHVDTGPVKLGMDNFGGLIVIWLVGTGASILIFMGELFMQHLEKKNVREKYAKLYRIKST